MYRRPIISQEWSVHAQLTISHHHPTEDTAPTIPPESEHHVPGGVHMEYSWGGAPTSPLPSPSSPMSSSSSFPHRTCYGFQRGNILFTTHPPPREPQTSSTVPASSSTLFPGVETSRLDSGYYSEHISPGPCGSLPSRRPTQPYNRRCKSTCSIVLSGSDHHGIASASMKPNVDCGSMEYTRNTNCSVPFPSDYKCNDPVCYHQMSQVPTHLQNSPRSSDFPPVPEICEVCKGGRSPTAIRRASATSTFTTHFCTHVPERVSKESKDTDTVLTTKPSRDATSQTSDHIMNAGSSLEKLSIKRSKPTQPTIGNKVAYSAVRHKTDSELLQLPMKSVPEDESKKPATDKCTYHSPAHRLSRSPARLRGQSPLLSSAGHKTKGFQCTPNQAFSTLKGKKGKNHKPRTVHIDVYCTGSEDADASDTSDDSDEVSDSWSSPRTVFESEKLRVVHARIGKDKLPMGYLHRQQQQQQQQKQQKIAGTPSRRSESFKYEAVCSTEQQVSRGYDSDDGLSSHYPSQISSFSAMQGAAETSVSQSDVSSTTSRESSWSTIPTSSLALSDEYDSAAATSWKDTTSDVDTLVQSAVSLAQSDSFEYADSADRLRIREKEKAWAGGEGEGEGEGSKTWKSPHVERKYLLQQQKFKEFIEKHLGKSAFPLWKTETTEDSDDETGDAWSFCGHDSNTFPKLTGKSLKREDTVKRVCSEKDKDDFKMSASHTNKNSNTSTLLTPFVYDAGSLSDSGPHRFVCRTNIGPFGTKLPSPPPSKLVSSVTSPFTTIPGKRTDQLSKAEKFGTIVGAFRKPGHHVGPSKNPVCACENCRKYYEDTGYRSRTQSFGELPLNNVSHRKNINNQN